MKPYLQAIEGAYRQLGVDQQYGLPSRGVFRITLSLSLALPGLIPSDFDFDAGGEMTRKLIIERPYVSYDPVGACIAANLLASDEDLLVFPAAQGDRLRFFGDRSRILQSNASIFNAVLVVSSAFCIKHDLRSGRKVTQAAHLARLRMFRLCLRA